MSDTHLTLMRIEHKLDMLIRAIQTGVMLPSPLPSLQDSGADTCPVCEHPYRWVMDLSTESVGRACGCKPNIAPVKGVSSISSSPQKETLNGREASSAGTSGRGSSGRTEG